MYSRLDLVQRTVANCKESDKWLGDYPPDFFRENCHQLANFILGDFNKNEKFYLDNSFWSEVSKDITTFAFACTGFANFVLNTEKISSVDATRFFATALYFQTKDDPDFFKTINTQVPQYLLPERGLVCAQLITIAKQFGKTGSARSEYVSSFAPIVDHPSLQSITLRFNPDSVIKEFEAMHSALPLNLFQKLFTHKMDAAGNNFLFYYLVFTNQFKLIRALIPKLPVMVFDFDKLPEDKKQGKKSYGEFVTALGFTELAAVLDTVKQGSTKLVRNYPPVFVNSNAGVDEANLTVANPQADNPKEHHQTLTL